MHSFKRLFVIAYIISSVSAFSKNINSEKIPVGFSLINSDFQAGIISKEDLLSQKFFYVFDRTKLNTKYKTEADQPVKCATRIIREFENQNHSFPKRGELNLYFKSTSSNSISSEHYISPSGIFEVNYETSGIHSVPLYDNDSSGIPDYIEMIAGYCDYSWKYLIDTLGYLQPDIGKRKYQIEFQKMYAAGYTVCDADDKNYTKIVLNNDLIEFGKKYGNGKDSTGAAKSTIVHELKHAVQYVYTQWRDKNWFLELDATWIEDIVYDDVNRYYNFLYTSQITEPGSSLANGMGYGNCIWMHYLTQSFGVKINKEIWETASSKGDIDLTEDIQQDILNEVLSSYKSSLSSAVTEFFVWNYFSGKNTNNKFSGYKESAGYPGPQISNEVREIPYSGKGGSRERLSANFIVIKSTKENFPFEIHLDFDDSYNNVVLIEKLTNGEIEIEYLEQEKKSVQYTSETRLKDIVEIVLIPVGISSGSGNYDYSYEINHVDTGIDFNRPIISIMNSNTELNKNNFPYMVLADISDETGIENAYIEYKFDNGNVQTTGLNKVESNIYCGYIYWDSSETNSIKELNYRIVASDSAALCNTGYFPAGGFFTIKIDDGLGVTGINNEEGIITEFKLFPNYPNPFNPSTKIRYALPAESRVRLIIYNILGKEVAVLENAIQNAGYHEVEWNAGRISSGTYIYNLTAESITGKKGYTQVKKMLLIK